MKTSGLIPLLLLGLMRTTTSAASPPADLVTASSFRAHTPERFALRSDGAHYNLADALGLYVEYKELRPASGALSPLETGLEAKPPVRLGGFLLSAGIRVYLK